MITSILLIITIIIISFWNGYVILWYLEKNSKYNKIWHQLGFIIRFILIQDIYLISYNILLTIIQLIVGSIIYDIIINLLMKQKWYYLGDTTIDKFLKQFLKFLKCQKQ